MRRLIDNASIRFLAVALVMGAIVIAGMLRGWSGEAIGGVLAAVGLSLLSFWKGSKAKASLLLLPVLLLAGCGANDARQLYGRAVLLDTSMHASASAAYDAANAGGVDKAKLAALTADCERVLSAERSVVDSLRSDYHALQAAEAANDEDAKKRANDMSRIGYKALSALADRLAAVLASSQQKGAP